MARIMSTKKIIPNPKPPKMPMVEILSATPPNSRHMTTLHSAQIAFGNFFYPLFPVPNFKQNVPILSFRFFFLCKIRLLPI